MQTKNLAIVGTGAVGGYYGGLLQRAGFNVHFLLHSDFEHVRKNGLVIESTYGDFTLPNVHAYHDPRDMPPCDIVVVALKTTANAALPSILPPLVGKDPLVLTLQNGLGSEEEIAGIVDPQNIIGGLCFLCSNKIGPGHIRHLDYGLITLGEYRADGQSGGITERLEKLGCDLKSAGIPIQLVEDLALARWKKLVWNIPFNGLSVIRNVLTDQLIKTPENRALCETLMNEVAAGAAACARPIEPAFISKMIADTERMEPYAPSMKLDYDRGNPMEIESIYGNPIRAAKAKGVPMPETEKLYHQLLALNPRGGLAH
ncbi:putative 2-dehydropantoate 2-reductase [Pontiella sp.]|uniref:putative 2-dehydropantoate 2-reductase n=1 Tax=Pontiella sp. TaxID=2837462 RepID=UPI003561742C